MRRFSEQHLRRLDDGHGIVVIFADELERGPFEAFAAREIEPREFDLFREFQEKGERFITAVDESERVRDYA